MQELTGAAHSVGTQAEMVSEAVRIFRLDGQTRAVDTSAVALRRQMKQAQPALAR